ncbi:hypothetical protein [Vibrio owensii]|uniref:hypothetical protein n=1 Tax=Vibrio owensii TaxID=696485 RepID=UPI004067779C
MKHLLLDLEAHRCPSVMSKTRLFLKLFTTKSEKYAVLQTIEPSAERDLKALIAGEFPHLSLIDCQKEVLTTQLRQTFLNSIQNFDEEDFSGCDSRFTYLIAKEN